MRVLPRTRAGTWAAAAVAWVAACAAAWAVMPVRPLAECRPSAPVFPAGFGPGGETVVTLERAPDGRWSGPVRVWDVTTGVETAALPLPSGSATHIHMSRDGRWLAFSLAPKGGLPSIWLLDLTAGVASELTDELPVGMTFLPGAFSADGLIAAVFVGQRYVTAVRVYDVTTRQLLLAREAGPILALAPDGRSVALTERVLPTPRESPATVALWDVRSGQLRHTFPCRMGR